MANRPTAQPPNKSGGGGMRWTDTHLQQFCGVLVLLFIKLSSELWQRYNLSPSWSSKWIFLKISVPKFGIHSKSPLSERIILNKKRKRVSVVSKIHLKSKQS
jgi:hypothetical protein